MTLALLWLMTLWLYLRERSPAAPGQDRAISLPTEESELLKALRRSCRQDDARQTRSLLRRWLTKFGPAGAHGSIGELVLLVQHHDLREQLSIFEAHGYREGSSERWDGDALWNAFSDWRKQRQPEETKNPTELPDLYARAR